MIVDVPIWASLPMPAFLVDSDDIIVDLNGAAEGFLNSSARSTKGESIWSRLVLDVALDAALKRVRDNNTPLFVNDAEVAVNGKAPMECSLQVAPVQSRRDLMIVLIFPREFASQITQGRTVKSAAQSAINMAELLAHEMKNPLAGIIGAAQLLSMQIGKPAYELTDHIVAESRRIVKLLEQVEQFGNLSEPELKPVNIHDILDRARRSALLGFAAHMTIIEQYDPSLPAALGDADQLLQVALNLLRNATEAAELGGGPIIIRTFFEHSFRLRRRVGYGHSLPLQVEFIDYGPGLPEDIRDQVFDPFVSGKVDGTGLGLALASKIISRHGGWISVSSVPGNTSFRLSLQRASSQGRKNAEGEI